MKNENASFGPQPKTTKRLSHVGIATAVQKLTVFLIKIVIQECVGDGCESFFCCCFFVNFFFFKCFCSLFMHYKFASLELHTTFNLFAVV